MRLLEKYTRKINYLLGLSYKFICALERIGLHRRVDKVARVAPKTRQDVDELSHVVLHETGPGKDRVVKIGRRLGDHVASGILQNDKGCTPICWVCRAPD